MDPCEMNDLSTKKRYETKIREFKDELEKWMKKEGDPGISLETQAGHQAVKGGTHLFLGLLHFAESDEFIIYKFQNLFSV